MPSPSSSSSSSSKILRLVRAVALSLREHVRESRKQVPVRVPMRATKANKTLPPSEVQFQRSLAQKMKLDVYGFFTDDGKPIRPPNLTMMRTVSRQARGSSAVSVSRLVTLLVVVVPALLVMQKVGKELKRRFYDERSPFHDYEFFKFAKEVVEGVLGELLLLRDSGGNDELRTVDDVKRHMMGLFEYEHGGKLVEILFDMYGMELMEAVSRSTNTEDVGGEVYSVVDLFRVASVYKTWLLDGDTVQEREEKAERQRQSDYQVCNGAMRQWWWRNVQKPLLENYIVSPLMEEFQLQEQQKRQYWKEAYEYSGGNSRSGGGGGGNDVTGSSLATIHNE